MYNVLLFSVFGWKALGRRFWKGRGHTHDTHTRHARLMPHCHAFTEDMDRCCICVCLVCVLSVCAWCVLLVCIFRLLSLWGSCVVRVCV